MSIFQKLFERDISENTKKALRIDMKHFIEWFLNVNGEAFSFSRLTARDIVDYKRYCQEKCNFTAKTVNRHLSSVKTLCDIAVDENYLQKNPSKGVKSLPLQPLAPKSLEKRELRALLKEVEIRGSLRDQLIVEMLCGAGLRASELINLKIEDLELSKLRGALHIKNSKGGKSRLVPLNKNLRVLADKYLQQYQPKEYLFVGQRGHLTAIAINKIIEVYARKAQVKCSPHTLRHSFAYNYLTQHSGDIVGLSQILGHSDLNTTAIYTQNRLEDLQDRVEDMAY